MKVCPSCGRENPADASFCSGCATPLEERAAAREERKIVTVLFCDLVGSTARAERLDPEDVRALLSRYHESVKAELERFGGTVEKFIGDAVMALFGAPVAHEDDPERAVRAALAVRDWADEEGDVQVRIGITTGEALVTLGARPERGEGMAAGDVVNTAARLQSAAAENGILVDETTYHATARAIDYEQQAPVTAKGKVAPVRVWRAAQARSRFGTDVRQIGRTPLVGRDEELTGLVHALERTKREREPQLLTVIGVPGLGKSRLVWELLRHVEQGDELTRWRQGRSLPYGEGVSFWALGEMAKAEAGILETDSPDETLRKLERALDAIGVEEADWIARHLRPLVGLGADEALSDSRTEAFAAWRRFVEALAEQRPTILVFEDLHWADDALLDFVDHLVDWARGVPLLVLATARPELLTRRPGWGGGKANAVTLSLAPLTDEETGRLVHALLDRAVLSAEVRASLLDRAGGNPLYAEEFARLVVERPGVTTLPESVQGIIAARLDGLALEEKELVQDAAVLGKVFWLGGLVDGRTRWGAEELLHALERKDIVRRERRSSVAGEVEYAFRHALLREVAYEQIPRARRAEKHVAAAAWIESLGRLEDHAELLARHFLAALELGEAVGADMSAIAPKATRTLVAAGDRSLALNSVAVARDLYRRALDLLPLDSPDRPDLLLRLSRALRRLLEGREVAAEAAQALAAAGDVEGSAEAELILADLEWHRGDREASRSHLDRATALLEDRPDSAAKARVLTETSRYRMVAGDDDDAIAIGGQAVAMAEKLGLEHVRVRALLNVATSQAQLGDPAGFAALAHAIELAERLDSPEALRGYNNLATSLAAVGDLKECFNVWRRGAEAADKFGESEMSTWVKHQVAFPMAYGEGRWDDLLASAEKNLEEPPHYLHRATYEHRGRVRLARGDVAGAVSDADASLALSRSAGDPQGLVPGLGFAAFARLAAGHSASAGALADELLALDATRRPVPHHSPWFDVAWVLVDLGRARELAAALRQAEPRTPWVDAAEAIARGDYPSAARIYASAGSVPAEAYTRLRAAEAGLPDAGLEHAVAFFRTAGATAYLAQAEELLAAAS